MKRWKVEQVTEFDSLEARLNELSAEGWTIVQVVPDRFSTVVCSTEVDDQAVPDKAPAPAAPAKRGRPGK